MTEIANGFNCETCGKWHDYSLYVYAHSRDVLKHTCDNCGAVHSVVQMSAKQTKKGKIKKKENSMKRVAASIERAKFPIPADIQAMWHLLVGCEALRDRYINLRFFGYPPAKKAAAEAELWRSKFWGSIYDLYPKLKGKGIRYDQYKCHVELLPLKRKPA